jgi:hypothetical protein
MRPDSQRITVIDSGDASSTCANFSDIDRRHVQNVPCPAQQAMSDIEPRADLVLFRLQNRTVLNNGGFRRRTSHIQRHEVTDPKLFSHLLSTHDPGSGTGLDAEGRPLGSGLGGGKATVRLHDYEGYVDASALQAVA